MKISIHALLAESDRVPDHGNSRRLVISIHALLAESDGGRLQIRAEIPIFLSTLSLRRATAKLTKFVSRALFLSTLSLRRATAFDYLVFVAFGISIHALLAESDHLLII